MRHSSSLCVIVLAAVAVFGCTSQNEPNRPLKPSDIDKPEMATDAPSINVVVADGEITIDDESVELPCLVESIKAKLGEPSRTLSLASVIMVWDNTGIFAYVSPDLQFADTLAFAMRDFDAAFWPNTRFNGQLSIDGLALTASTSHAELSAADYDGFGVVLWFRQSGNLGVDVQTNNQNVVSVAIAPDE